MYVLQCGCQCVMQYVLCACFDGVLSCSVFRRVLMMTSPRCALRQRVLQRVLQRVMQRALQCIFKVPCLCVAGCMAGCGAGRVMVRVCVCERGRVCIALCTARWPICLTVVCCSVLQCVAV